jgi:hypothetical protein
MIAKAKRPIPAPTGRFLRPETLAGALTAMVMLAALLLAYSQFQDLFRIVSPSGVVLDAPRAIRDGTDQHGLSLVLLAIAAVGGAVLALVSRQPLPAWGAAALGLIALVITLAFDLPDATSSGLSEGGQLGDAEPAVGLWLQLAGSAALLAASAGLALVIGRSKARSAARRARAPRSYQR